MANMRIYFTVIGYIIYFFMLSYAESTSLSRVRHVMANKINETQNILIQKGNTLTKSSRDNDVELQEFIKVNKRIQTAKKTTTVELLMNSQYLELEPSSDITFIEDSTIPTSPETTTTRTYTKRLYLKKLKDLINYVLKSNDSSLKSPMRFDKLINLANFTYYTQYFTKSQEQSTRLHRQYMSHPLDLKSKQTYKRTKRAHSGNLIILPEYQQHWDYPPFVKYDEMQARDEMGHKLFLNDSQDRPSVESCFRYPQARQRWWWEYEKHFMHWYFWHCTHWMTHWNRDPPVSANQIPEKLHISDQKEDDQEYQSSRKDREYRIYNYCNWLINGELKNLGKFGDNLKSLARMQTENPRFTTTRSTFPPTKKAHEYTSDYQVGLCYYCGRQFIDHQPTIRLCHRAFTDEKYFHFRKWLRGNCMERPEFFYYDKAYYARGPLRADGTIDLYGVYHNDSCFWHYLDIGELYTERGCRRKRYYRSRIRNHIRSLFDGMELTLIGKKDEGCVASPYSVFAPFSRSKPGLFIRAYACTCKGKYCNTSSNANCNSASIVYILIAYSLIKCIWGKSSQN